MSSWGCYVRLRWVGIAALCVGVSCQTWGDLQNVSVGGKIEIYGAWYSDFFEPAGSVIRIPDFFLPRRPVGPQGTASTVRAGEGGNEISFFEQRTRLHVVADFTSSVKAYVEFDGIDTWGEGFQSDYITGADSRRTPSDEVALYQAFVEVQEPHGFPLALRIGRQELEFGSGWLVGADPGPDPFVGLSFDAIRLTYCQGPFTVDGWWSKLADRSPVEQDGDIDFFGIYATFTESEDAARTSPMRLSEIPFPLHLMYHGLRRTGPFRGRSEQGNEKAQFDVYWMYVRDAASRNDTNFSAPLEWLEDRLQLDNYDVTGLNVVGTRGAGTVDSLVWELEVAYEWGDASAVGYIFRPVNQLYGDDHARWNTWAGHAEIGYTLGGKPGRRLFAGAAYYGGEDNRGLSIAQWLNPFEKPRASVSFNRLFSSWREDNIVDSSNLTNFWKAYAGAKVSVSDAIILSGMASYYQVIKPFDRPAMFTFADWQIPIAPALSFWTQRGSSDLGWQTAFWCTYMYTQDISFEVGWTHFFTGDAIEDGAFIDNNGTAFVGGIGKSDMDYLYFLTTVEF